MPGKELLYSAKVDSFLKRWIKVLYPDIIIPSVMAWLPLFGKTPGNIITVVWMTMMFLLLVMTTISSYKWVYYEVAAITTDKENFEVEVVAKNTARTFTIGKHSLVTQLKWVGNRPPILQLSLFDNSNRIADLYSGGRR